MIKTFKYDVILDEADLCNREAEKKRLISVIKRNGRIVLYSIRRMGKTSLTSVCSKILKKQNPDTFYLYVDLNEVTSFGDVTKRFWAYFESALKEQFPLQRAKSLMGNLIGRVKVHLPGKIELSLDEIPESHHDMYLMELFKELGELSKTNPIIMTVDEFQAIAHDRESQAILRQAFQKLNLAGIVLMGSNQRLLYHMLNDKSAPFFGFGEDLELTPISIEHYLPYLEDRFSKSNLLISKEVAIFMLDQMNNIPNYINELGAWLVDTMSNTELTYHHIETAIYAAVHTKRGRYTSALYGYRPNEKKFFKAIAKKGFVESPTGKDMQELTDLSPSELLRVSRDMDDCPLISRDSQNRLFIIDPFLQKFLMLF